MESEEGVKKETNIVDEAKETLEKLTKEREALEAERKKIEELHANQILSGKSVNQGMEQKKEMTDEEYVASLKKGELPKK